ncbi:3'(2'),5'-bisphosphate nucleotidase CysQ [Komagataeibacter sp. FNDCR2]|uniref:3'(2'),5'-bisphosphate nucleotidase CysQ n=1 Tax=Komagataeibacter sp. FNDCR2 TaxID=2878682 RepID=UPI001E3C4BA3|nr:3'(2'),5'-bisphosphate nucleotidase CysQ [Komagataeibacter sp. FNDCR2]MCE2574981.1 3'(2'),5'-bisphosphate nucleotidase CysQ [Komagataeibacter sp. FNDCR2]
MNTPSIPVYEDGFLLDLALRLADEAAELIRAIRARGFETRIKTDSSPVTEADHAAEVHILKGLRAHAPAIPVVAEEEMAAGIHIDTGSEFWLVDPLDGTREFAAGRDDFTVNIGLVRHGRPVLGAVALPAYHQLYGAGAGRGAVRIDASGEQAIHVRRPPAEGLTVLASRHHADDARLRDFLGGHAIAHLGNIGSAAKFIRVAEGVADLYPRLGPTMEWDTAAPQAIVEAAGGSITTMDGAPLGYGKPGWRNPHFLCRGAT